MGGERKATLNSEQPQEYWQVRGGEKEIWGVINNNNKKEIKLFLNASTEAGKPTKLTSTRPAPDFCYTVMLEYLNLMQIFITFIQNLC